MATLSASPPQGRFARWRADHASQITDLRRGAYRFSRNRLSVIGLALVIVLLIVAVTAPLWIPYPDDVTGNVNMAERLMRRAPRISSAQTTPGATSSRARSWRRASRSRSA